MKHFICALLTLASATAVAKGQTLACNDPVGLVQVHISLSSVGNAIMTRGLGEATSALGGGPLTVSIVTSDKDGVLIARAVSTPGHPAVDLTVRAWGLNQMPCDTCIDGHGPNNYSSASATATGDFQTVTEEDLSCELLSL